MALGWNYNNTSLEEVANVVYIAVHQAQPYKAIRVASREVTPEKTPVL